MLQQLLPLLPAQDQNGSAVIGACVLGALAGIVLWLAGARYSRMVVTLVAVTIGGFIGMLAPRIMGWTANTMATAMAGAMLLGLIGFILHGTFVGIAFVCVLSLWAAVGTWLACHGDSIITWPADAVSPAEFVRLVWDQLPDAVRGPMPVAIGLVGLAGGVVTLARPKVAMVLGYSVAGVTLLVVMGLWAMKTRSIWPNFVPTTMNLQVAIIAAMVFIGAVVQWQWLPRKTKPASSGGAE